MQVFNIIMLSSWSSSNRLKNFLLKLKNYLHSWINTFFWNIHSHESGFYFFNHVCCFSKDFQIQHPVIAPFFFVACWFSKSKPPIVLSKIWLFSFFSRFIIFTRLICKLRMIPFLPLCIHLQKHNAIWVFIFVVATL